MAKDKYIPIACGDYDIYEIAIMHNARLDLEWRDENGQVNHQSVKPIELKIKQGAEYLIILSDVNDADSKLEIRLDRIIIVK